MPTDTPPPPGHDDADASGGAVSGTADSQVIKVDVDELDAARRDARVRCFLDRAGEYGRALDALGASEKAPTDGCDTDGLLHVDIADLRDARRDRRVRTFLAKARAYGRTARLERRRS